MTKSILALIFTFIYSFACGCNQQKVMLSTISSVPIAELESIDIYMADCNQLHSWMNMIFIPKIEFANDYFLFQLLHEYAHIKLQHKTITKNMHEQEFSADQLAMSMSLKYHLDISLILNSMKNEKYSESTSHPSSLVRYKMLLTQ